MPLFEQFKAVPDSRSNTKLVVSGGDSPAEEFIVDPTLPVKFKHEYGGWGQQEVVIAKGQLCAIGDPVKDTITGEMRPTLTIADGTNPVIGVAPYNISKNTDDRFDGNQPSVITKNYIEVPYIPDNNYASNVHWGLATGNLNQGDLVKANGNGKFVKWEEGTDSIRQIVGTLWAIEQNIPPAGWLKWAMLPDSVLRQMENPGEAPGEDGYPWDPQYGWPTEGREAQDATGIPGLTDAYNMSKEDVAAEELGTVSAGATAGTNFVFKTDHTPLVDGTLVLKADGAPINTDNFTVNEEKGEVTYTLESDVGASDVTITADYTHTESQWDNVGVPTGWDFQGSTGAARILLRM
jgi:hypothetical protein